MHKRARLAMGPVVLAPFAFVALAIACGTEAEPIPDPSEAGATSSTSSSSSSSSGASSSGASSSGASSGTSGTSSGASGTDGSTTDASTAPFCSSLAPKPTICEDFDAVAALPPAGWFPQRDDAGNLTLETAAFKSTPKAMRATVTQPNGQVARALIGRVVKENASTGNNTTKLVVSWSFRPNAAAPATGTLVIARAFLDDTHAVAVELQSENGAVLRQQILGPGGTTEKVSEKLTVMPTPAQFNDMVLSVDLTNTTATLTLNGAQVAALKLGVGGSIKRLSANVGLQSDRSYSAVYDNIVLDAQ